MSTGYYVDENGTEYTYDEGKLNFDDWCNEVPEEHAKRLNAVTSELGSALFTEWMTYANATPFGVAGFEKGYRLEFV